MHGEIERNAVCMERVISGMRGERSAAVRERSAAVRALGA